MSEQQQQQPQRPRLYRLDIVRPDGSRTSIMRNLPFDALKRARQSILDAGIDVDLQIVPEDG